MKETDIDRLRSQWKNLDLNLADLDQHTREVADALSRNRTIGMRQRLRRRFMLAIVGCCLCPLWLFGTAQLQLSWSFRIVYAMFFVAMALLNYLQYRALGRIDIVKSTVGDALQSVFRFKVLRRRCKLTGCVLAAPLLVWLFIHIYNIG
ncbi:MAG: hypothetical protein K2L49_02720, partial [Muribaculaceae bacterium]|nr:hypothetical protein [Muribaculaceae bacterium]